MTSISPTNSIKLEVVRPITAKDVANAIPGDMSMLTAVKVDQDAVASKSTSPATDPAEQEAAAKAHERTVEAFAKLKVTLQSKTSDLI